MKALFQNLPAEIPIGIVLLISLIFSGLLGVLDHLTGYEISFSIFYLAPVAFSSWYGNRRSGLILSLVSAVVWLIVDATAGHQYRSVFILIWNSGVRFGFFVIVTWLLTAIRRNLIREKENSRIDQLTGVRNMNGFLEEAESLWELARRHNHQITIGYMDLDNFKAVNDSMGHSEGDTLLKAVAAAMQSSLRSTDILGRLGGDEFAAVLPETDKPGAEEVFRKTQETLTGVASRHGWPVTLSIGAVVVKSSCPLSLTEALKYADELMYTAKGEGKNYTCIRECDSSQGLP